MKPVLWDQDMVRVALGVTSEVPWKATGVSIDSRSLEPGDMFVALAGERVDGHRYIDQAIAQGAAAVIAHSAGSIKEQPRVPILLVEDSLVAFEQLGCFRRNQYPLTVV